MSEINIPPHLKLFGASKVQKAKDAFNNMITEIAGENVIAQITAAGKTKLIADTCREVMFYGSQGSLYEAFVAVERITLTPEMAPFLTEARRQIVKNKIIDIINRL